MDALQLLPSDRNDRPARMAPLAKLPVFWALEGKRAIVAGGSDAAAWKAELLAACGAEVHVYAEELSETFATLMQDDGRFEHHKEQWSPSSFQNAAIAIADCEDDDAAAAFFDAACRTGVPVNVIDKPKYCQFQFGSIVNRSPVVVANLKPRKLRGYESQGMLLAASVGDVGKPVLATFTEDVPNGARLK